VSLASLLKEWDKALATRRSSFQHDIPAYAPEFAMQVGIIPDDWQVEVLASDHPRKILLAGRQTGKTTSIALLVAHRAITVPGSEILIVAPSERQAKRLFRVAKLFWRRAGEPHGAVSDRLTGLELGNGSVIEAVAAVEHTTRGFSPTLLVVEEAAFMPSAVYYQLQGSTVRTAGEEILLSTAGFKDGFFYDVWSSDEDWHRVQIRSDEMPQHISPEQLERRRLRMPREFFEAEYCCKFLETTGGLFGYDDIQAALELGEDVEALEIGGEEW
jgi:Terminase large subunit, T4likevirus-type, N-terminal